ncbi:MAG TPA: hypothetical protein VFM69_00865 [Pricia sp.]|nr:hypothetical protein [Pricia sp.]
MRAIERFLDIFRKKDFYQVDYEILKNEFSITFREVSDNDLSKIKETIINSKDTEVIENDKAELYINNCVVYENIDDLISGIVQILKADYKDTFFKSKKFGWDFEYILNSFGGLYPSTLFISNSMTYPNDEDFGNVIYQLLAIKKKLNKYYLWDLLDREDEVIPSE